MFSLLQSLQNLRRSFTVYKKAMKDPRTPRAAKFLLLGAMGYTLMPFDIIPDWIPFLGQIDDIIIVPMIINWAIQMIPPDVLKEQRKRVKKELIENRRLVARNRKEKQ